MESGEEMQVRNLYGLDCSELSGLLARYDVPSFHGGQLFRWMYARRTYDAEAWTDLPKPLRALLTREARVDPGTLVERARAVDGTVKYRIELAGGGSVESVYLEQSGRVTLCLSSQVGCALKCDFCLTGKMGFGRHLTPGEIVGQAALIQTDRGLGDRVFNVVFMGMGEPLHNYEGAVAAFRLLVDPAGFGLSCKRITISTAGLAPEIERLAGEPVRPRLAVSLNATTDEVRDRIMPVNRKWPIRRLLEACRSYAERTGEPVTFEYVLLAGVNDTTADVTRLSRILRRTSAKLNLIPFNPVPGWLPYRPPSRRSVIVFRDRLLDMGLRVGIRWSRGIDARAACGQLALLPEAPGARRTEG